MCFVLLKHARTFTAFVGVDLNIKYNIYIQIYLYGKAMELIKQFSLQHNNSFNIPTISPTLYQLTSLNDLSELPDLDSNSFYILGEGTNSLFVDAIAPIIIKPDFKGVSISENNTNYIVKVASGENWHDLVTLCIEKGINGLENLALIPGSVGAAPVQNIGAYGVEFSDFCMQVNWYDFSSKTIKCLKSSDCLFGYRESIFKNKLFNKGVITEVLLSFPKIWQAKLSYTGLQDLGLNPSAIDVMDKVISLRQSKLPDPKLLPNAGSFFKNPVVSKEKLLYLHSIYPNMPFYPQDENQVKLAAGWLIDQVGLKGYCKDGVGVHEHQALVLVNHNSKNGKDILALAKLVQSKVFESFGILLSPEVHMVTSQGKIDFADLPPTSNRKCYD